MARPTKAYSAAVAALTGLGVLWHAQALAAPLESTNFSFSAARVWCSPSCLTGKNHRCIGKVARAQVAARCIAFVRPTKRVELVMLQLGVGF
jgi:hypothetical protein